MRRASALLLAVAAGGAGIGGCSDAEEPPPGPAEEAFQRLVVERLDAAGLPVSAVRRGVNMNCSDAGTPSESSWVLVAEVDVDDQSARVARALDEGMTVRPRDEGRWQVQEGDADVVGWEGTIGPSRAAGTGSLVAVVRPVDVSDVEPSADWKRSCRADAARP